MCHNFLNLLIHSVNSKHLLWIRNCSCLEPSLVVHLGILNKTHLKWQDLTLNFFWNNLCKYMQHINIHINLKMWHLNTFFTLLRMTKNWEIMHVIKMGFTYFRPWKVLKWLSFSHYQGSFKALVKFKNHSILLLAKRPLQNLWKDGRENKGAYVSDFFIKTATSKAQVINSFLKHKI